MPGSSAGMTCCRAARVSSWATALTRGQMVRVPTSDESAVLSFVRAHEGDEGGDADTVFAVLNLSASERQVTFGEGPHHGTYVDAFTGEPVELGADARMTLPPWAYVVLTGAASG